MIRYLLGVSLLFIGCTSVKPAPTPAKQTNIAPVTSISVASITTAELVEITEELPEVKITFSPNKVYKLIIKPKEVENRYDWLVQQARLASEIEPLVLSDEYEQRIRLWAKEHAISGAACQLLYESPQVEMGDSPIFTDPPWFTVTNIPENFEPTSDLLELCDIVEWFTPRGVEEEDGK